MGRCWRPPVTPLQQHSTAADGGYLADLRPARFAWLTRTAVATQHRRECGPGLLLVAPSGLGVVGLVTGIGALPQIRGVLLPVQGRGVAIAGCITSGLTLLTWVLFWVFVLVVALRTVPSRLLQLLTSGFRPGARIR